MAESLPVRTTVRRSVVVTTESITEPRGALSSSMFGEGEENTLTRAFARAMAYPGEEIAPSETRPRTARYLQLQSERSKLPVSQYKEEFMKYLENNQVIVVEGETGCGKTTQIPQWCLEYTQKKKAVACTQPRRMAATSIAQRVAEEMGVNLGEEVGYHIRFDKKTSTNTILTYMTDGILLRQIASCRTLDEYGVILLDETHERGTFTDVLMGLLVDLVKVRPDFRLVIMSATLDTQKFKNYFGHPPVLKIKGRLHRIEVIYSAKNQWNSMEAVVKQVKEIHQNEPRGDILVFMTGKAEIEASCSRLEAWVNDPSYRRGKLCILPLYSDLPKEEQDLVFEPAPPDNAYGPSRKVVVATNIAETSITIDGIVFVIDCGFMNVKTYERKTRVEILTRVRTTQTNARQRSGRAGRTQPGKCFRLYTEAAFKAMKPYILPEVLRSNLSSIVLDMKSMAIEEVLDFNFMDRPERDALLAALTELRQLRALDRDNSITQLGSWMSEFPVDPRVAKVIVQSCREYGCPDDVLIVAAMLSVPPCFIQNKKRHLEIREAKKKFMSPYGDHIMLLKLYKAYKANGEKKSWCRENFVHYRYLMFAVGIISQLKAITQKMGLYKLIPDTYCLEYENVRKALLSGFCLQVAFKYLTGYRTLYEKDTVVEIDDSTGLTDHPDFVIYHERLTIKSKHILKVVSPIDSKWWDDVVGISVEELLGL